MLRKSIATALIIFFSITILLPPAFSQDEGLTELLKQGVSQQLEREREKLLEARIKGMLKVEWRTFKCPVCEREFQMPVPDVASEMTKGLTEVVCPYDGTRFIPREVAMRRALKVKADYVDLVSPYEKRSFKARIAPASIAAGAVITDPYTGNKFRYVPQLIKKGEEWREVVSPVDGRKFRVRLFTEDSLMEVSSPYDGRRFSPNWQLISESQRFSEIERMFSREIPITVSKAIRQFGYDLFPEEAIIKKIGEKKKEEKFDKGEEGLFAGHLDAEQLLKRMSAGMGVAPQFGEEIYTTLTTIPVSDDYVLGPGDKLIINLWGNIQQTFDLDIDGEGKVMLPKAGPLYLWGIKFGEAKRLIQENLSEYFTNFQINVSMGRLRSIKIFVLGEAKKPGAYTVSSLSTVFSVLYQAGGPSKIGTLRKIRLTRANKTEETIDLYSYLLQGDRAQDFKLDAGDTIFIPPIGGVVGIAGNVKRPAIYELKSTITLDGLLEMSGGISAVGYLQRIQVERIEQHQRKIVFDLEFENMQALESSASNTILQDGDLVMISAITPVRHNYVSITGNVQRPGDYELKPDMKLKDLLDEAGSILPGTYLKRAEVSRFRDDKTREIWAVNLKGLLNAVEEENIKLKEWDRFYVFIKSEVVPTFFVNIEGAVYKPGAYELVDNMRISDLIFRGGGLRKTASLKNAELYRMVLGEEPKIISVDLTSVFDPRTKENDLYIQEGDQLFIREEAKWLEKREIVLSGEVVYPGKYIAQPREHLSSVIKRAGGFTEKAFLSGAVFTRNSVEEYQRKMVKKFIDSEQEAILKESSSLAMGLSGSQSEARKELVEYRQKQLETLESIVLIGRIVIKLDSMEKFEGSASDIVLENGDRLYIPPAPSSVQIVGNVRMTSAIAYVEGRGLSYYINRAGGLTKNADKKGIFVIKPSGEAVGRFAKVRKIERGDTIIVPEVFKYKVPPGLLLKDAFSLASQITVVALALSAAR